MEEWKEFSAKTADEALTNALIQMDGMLVIFTHRFQKEMDLI